MIFLFVVDTSFISPGDPALAKTVADELERLGRALLHIAQARAEKQGMSAGAAVRHGRLQPTVEDFLREVNASALVLGTPGAGSEKRIFSRGELPRFAAEIGANTGAEVIVVE